MIQVDEEKLGKSRKDVFNYLRSKGIGVQVHYIPVYWHPYYQELGYGKGLCKVAESIYKLIISLPIYPAMNSEDIIYILDELYYIS